jgi:hypothetical protein
MGFKASKETGYAQKDAINKPTGNKNISERKDGRRISFKLENCLLNNKRFNQRRVQCVHVNISSALVHSQA